MMTQRPWQPWLRFGGHEIGNAERTIAYIRAGLVGDYRIGLRRGDCDECDVLVDEYGPFVDPAADDAPWYDATVVESTEFLGFLPEQIEVSSPWSRPVAQRIGGGATLGRLTLRGRSVGVRGKLVASSKEGMAYGAAWLAEVLSCPSGDCELSDLCLLSGCDVATPRWRTLRRAGLVDGPLITPIEDVDCGLMQDVAFQMATENGWFYADATTCLDWGLNVYALDLPGTTGHFASTPDDPALDITGNIDIRAKVALDDWTPAASQSVVAKWTSTGNQRSYLVRIATSGAIQLTTSATGSGTTVSSQSSDAVGFTDGTAHWVRVTWSDAANATNFYTSDDGVDWTLLGTADRAHVSAGIFASAAALEVGSFDVGTAGLLASLVYSAEVRNGIDGTVVASPVFDQPVGTTSFVDDQGNEWTVNGASSAFVSTGEPTERCCIASTPQWPGQATMRIVIEAGGPDAVTGVEVSATPTRNSECPVAGTATPCMAFTIDELGPGHILIVDGTTRTVEVRENSSGLVVGGLEALTFDGPFGWPDIAPCSQMCVCATPGTVNDNTTILVETYPRES